MMTFDHPNVMSLIGICIDRDIPLIIMPFMSNGSVLDSVRTNRRELHFESEGSTIQVHYLQSSYYYNYCTVYT